MMDDRTWDGIVDMLVGYWCGVERADVRAARACAQLADLVRASLPASVARSVRRLSAAQRAVVRDTVKAQAERDPAARALA